MTRGFLPNTDAGLLAFSANFSSLISASPGTYGISTARAEEYQGLHAAFALSLAACDPNLRNKVSTSSKNDARAAMKLAARQLAYTIYGEPTVSDAQKIALGLTVRSSPTAIAVPSSAPVIFVKGQLGWTLKIKLRDSGSTESRGIPVNVSGASVFSFVGAEPPSDLSAWKFEGNTGRSSMSVQFPSTLPPGTKVWLTAFWFNGRKQSGPVCSPVTTNLAGGSVAMAA